MNDLEQKNLLQTEAQVSDELSTDELEEINGGILPVVAGALAIGGVVGVAVAATYAVGAVKGWMDSETEHAEQGCSARN